VTVITARASFLSSLINWIEKWIRENIIADGYEDDDGFHYVEPR
jgi:hypothetical protein